MKLKPGYWVAWCPWYESYEVVSICSDLKSFMILGYDQPTTILSAAAEGWEFLKPFDPEDIVLNVNI